jgi:hypothetical protein
MATKKKAVKEEEPDVFRVKMKTRACGELCAAPGDIVKGTQTFCERLVADGVAEWVEKPESQDTE